METQVTIGILSDTHGFLDSRVAEVVNNCDFIIHAGDIGDAKVLEELTPRKHLLAVAGNNDFPAAWVAAHEEIVSNLVKTHQLDLPGGFVFVEHGHRLGNKPDHDQFRKDHANARMVVYGHTHKRIIDRSNVPWVVNPGAAGAVRTHGGPSCLVLTASEDNWEIEEIVFKSDEIH